jgi:hypothetical protein
MLGGVWILPAIAALVAFAFAGMLARRFAERRRDYELAWALAMVFYGLASCAVVLGSMNGWTSVEFAVYWALGAVLNVPFLAAGEIMLLVRRPWVQTATWLVLIFLGAYVVAVLRAANGAVQADALLQRLPSGKHVFGGGTPAHRLAQLIAIPSYVILVAGALWSAWAMRGEPALRDRFTGTLLIALGATLIAGFGSAFAALGMLAPFAIALLAGVSVMFWGFLLAAGPGSARRRMPEDLAR